METCEQGWVLTRAAQQQRTMPESKAQRKARMKAEKKAKLEAKRAAAKDERALREDAERAAEVATAAIKVYVDRGIDEVIGPLITNAIQGDLDDAIRLHPAAAPAHAPRRRRRHQSGRLVTSWSAI